MGKFVTPLHYEVNIPEMNFNEYVDLKIVFIDYADNDWERVELEVIEVSVMNYFSDEAGFLAPMIEEYLKDDAELQSYLYDHLHNLDLEQIHDFY